MKIFRVLAFALLGFCAYAQQPITFAPPSIVQSTGNVTSSGTTVTAVLTPIAGDTWIAMCGVNNVGTIAVSDNNSNTWNTAKSQTGTTAGVLISFAINATAGATTVTCTAGTSGVVTVQLYEMRGLLSQIPAQPEETDANTGSSQTSAVLLGGLTPETPNQIAFSAVVLTTNNAGTAGSGWTLDTQQGAVGGRLLPARRVLPNINPIATGNTVATFSSASYALAAATFKPVIFPVQGEFIQSVTADVGMAASRCTLISAASTNATSCKTGPGISTVSASSTRQRRSITCGCTTWQRLRPALPRPDLLSRFRFRRARLARALPSWSLLGKPTRPESASALRADQARLITPTPQRASSEQFSTNEKAFLVWSAGVSPRVGCRDLAYRARCEVARQRANTCTLDPTPASGDLVSSTPIARLRPHQLPCWLDFNHNRFGER
jgi:hypothetical protein